MTFHAPTLIQRLRELQQQIAEAPRHAESLHAALDGQDGLDALCTDLDAERHLRAMAVTTADIKSQVITSDGLGAKVESLSELVFRAVRVVVLAEVSTLADVVSEAYAGGRPPALALGPFEHVDDWRSYVAHAVNGITQGWICYRGMDGADRAAYRAELREAHAAMRQLGESSRAALFLREAVARADWPSFQEVCSRISTALAIRIDVDPDMLIMVVSPPQHDAAVRQAPMSGDEQGQRPRANLSPRPVEDDPAPRCWAAIDSIVRLTFELTSAIAVADFPEAVRASGELELALLNTDVLAETLSDDLERAEVLRQLRELDAIAKRQLAIAPAPTLAAIEAAEAGDESLWRQEAQAWIAARRASGAPPPRFARGSISPHPRRRPAPSDTRPGTPRALREAPNGAGDAIPVSTLAASSSSDKVGAR